MAFIQLSTVRQVRPVWAWPCCVGVPIHLLCKWAKVVCLCVCVCACHKICQFAERLSSIFTGRRNKTETQRTTTTALIYTYIWLKGYQSSWPPFPSSLTPLPGCAPFPFAAVCLQIYAVQANPHGDFCLKRFIVASHLPLPPSSVPLLQALAPMAGGAVSG